MKEMLTVKLYFSRNHCFLTQNRLQNKNRKDPLVSCRKQYRSSSVLLHFYKIRQESRLQRFQFGEIKNSGWLFKQIPASSLIFFVFFSVTKALFVASQHLLGVSIKGKFEKEFINGVRMCTWRVQSAAGRIFTYTAPLMINVKICKYVKILFYVIEDIPLPQT